AAEKPGGDKGGRGGREEGRRRGRRGGAKSGKAPAGDDSATGDDASDREPPESEPLGPHVPPPWLDDSAAGKGGKAGGKGAGLRPSGFAAAEPAPPAAEAPPADVARALGKLNP
ncbi:unnamed protein product, partial [Prorocentrum cordatum]